ncbi:hypothetical protein V7S43_009328 [Phytophthora oleae]|uniref:Pectate lyase n=1 Tax=Phytophthora oleae TaxID=2107226 RepID=A0ABD3FLL7_9STRA
MEDFSGVAVRILRVGDSISRHSTPVNTLIVASHFLVGEDWMYDNGVKIDFVAGKLKWYEDDVKKGIPFTGKSSMNVLVNYG